AGITTYADTGDSGVVATAMREYGVRGIMYQEVFGPDPSQCGAAMADLKEKVARHMAEATPLVRVGVSPHAPYTVSDGLFRAATTFAREADLPMAIHIAESAIESRLVVHADGPFADALRARGFAVAPRAASPVQLLANLDVLAARPLLIHCVRVDAHDLSTIANARCAIAHCPISNAKLGHGIAPLFEIQSAGITVGLGSDSVASNNRMDLIEEARVALLMQRARIDSHKVPTAMQVLELATIGGARSLGLSAVVGSLEVGKSADLAAFPLDESVPVQDPVDTVIHALGGTPASFVAVAGVPLVVDGRRVGSSAGLASRVQRHADALRDWLAADEKAAGFFDRRPPGGH
ncbi:MAG TPA: amidohydrolase family protein, partial [Gemmatimonadaceae bacterium]|nr:amidohydrolase family protein [Gemmatimonadaceae bacterium]